VLRIDRLFGWHHLLVWVNHLLLLVHYQLKIKNTRVVGGQRFEECSPTKFPFPTNRDMGEKKEMRKGRREKKTP
jgi:hypothetical protein